MSRRLLSQYAADQLLQGNNDIITQLAAYIIDHHMQKHIDQLVGDIEYELAARGHVLASVTSATALSSELNAAISSTIAARSKAERVELTSHIDAALIGGIVIETPTYRIDRSVATRLKKLQTEL